MPSPHDQAPTFFLDRDLGRYTVANALRKANAKVETHADHFPPDVSDEIWLKEVGRRGWVVLSKDRHILTRVVEITALVEAGVHAFILRQSRNQELTGDEMGQAFCGALPHMTRLVAQHTPPFLGRVTPTGKVAGIEGYKSLIKRLPHQPPTQ